MTSRWLLPGWIVIALALAGCADEDLLSIPVGETELRDASEFNRSVAAAAAAGEEWPDDPLEVARRFQGRTLAQQSVWALDGRGESPSRYHVTGIAQGFTDDSVRGERFDLVVERANGTSWRIVRARVSWRCWPDRGHSTFDVEPCS